MASNFNSFPPHKLISSRNVRYEEALDLITRYLDAADVDISLQPNAILTTEGPEPAAQGGGSGLILHNLKRVQAGLQGENLGADLSFANFGGEGLPDLFATKMGDSRLSKRLIRPSLVEHTTETEIAQTDWQDKAQYEREQESEEGDLGERTQVIPADATGVPSRGQAPAPTQDKGARKEKKKERLKQERREREARRRQAMDAE